MAVRGSVRFIGFLFLFIAVAALASSFLGQKPHSVEIGKPTGDVLKAKQSDKDPGQSTPNAVSINVDLGSGSPDSYLIGHLKPADAISLPSPVVAVIAILGSLNAFVIYPNRIKQMEMRLRLVEDQLSQLYGPLLAECVTSDSTFRRVELAFTKLHSQHRHYNLRNLKSSDFSETAPARMSSETRYRRAFAYFIVHMYLPLNKRRMEIIQHNLHLIGPYPPVSLNLFLTHAAQFESLIRVKQQLDLEVGPTDDLDRYKDPYILMPFPAMLTAEVVANVALLKALQNEYRHRIGRSLFRVANEVFFRDQYFLILRKDLRGKLCIATYCGTASQCAEDPAHLETPLDLQKSLRKPNQRAFYAPTCPLIWGPYTAVELLS